MKYLWLIIISLLFACSRWSGTKTSKETPDRYLDDEGMLHVTVDNIDSFIVNLRSNTHIQIATNKLYLDSIHPTIRNKHLNLALVLFDEIMYDEDVRDDQTILLSGIENLRITAADGYRPELVTGKLHASVMAFDSCINLKLEGLKLGHDNEILRDKSNPWASYCSGKVLDFFNCTNIYMSHMDLYGCGTWGFLAHRCKDIRVLNSTIHDCTYGAFGVYDCDRVTLDQCTFEKNLYRRLFEIENSGKVVIRDGVVANNRKADRHTEHVLHIDEKSELILERVSFSDNAFSPSEIDAIFIKE